MELPGVKAIADHYPTAILGGIKTARLTRKELADQMVEDVIKARAGLLKHPNIVVSSNGLVISLYHRDAAFRDAIEAADIVDADGMPLVLAAKLLLKEPLRERVATTDFILDAAEAAVPHGTRFYFLGALPGIAAKAADNLRAQFPELQIAGHRHGYFEEEDLDGICEDILRSGTDILWLGLGSPLQEILATRIQEKLPGVAWIRTCGGLFDHIGAGVPRAPLWMQNIGFEWLHRALLEPRRLGLRYLVTNPQAVYHLLTKTR